MQYFKFFLFLFIFLIDSFVIQTMLDAKTIYESSSLNKNSTVESRKILSSPRKLSGKFYPSNWNELPGWEIVIFPILVIYW
ncbi:MAG: hypothetical protein IR526_00010 [Bordetella sp.]|nr:MAG: hypothetical protein IR526_00010 [Bordetella sp.]